ncbi:hypothetical protein HDU67_010021, partial [Dinochytrium kinnereticum]
MPEGGECVQTVSIDRPATINIMLLLPLALNDTVPDPIQNAFSVRSVITAMQIGIE